MALPSIFPELGLGLAFTLISLAPMVPDFVGQNDHPKIKVNVMAGLPNITVEEHSDRERIYKDRSFGGSAPTISLFNANGDRVGFLRNKGGKNTIKQNQPKDLMIDYIEGGNTEKAEYMTVTAGGNDAICISAIWLTHPASSDSYAFLPGEVAHVCQQHDPEKNYYTSQSSTSIQFKGPDGNVKEARPRCMWIDKPDNKGRSATHFQGFQVHLPDFKLDNTTFKSWEQDPAQMCDSLARFGAYDISNEVMCPQIFIPAPKYGARLPLREVRGCLPSIIPAAEDGKLWPDVCDDPRLQLQDRFNIAMMYDIWCKRDWFYYCVDAFGVCDNNFDQRKRSIGPREKNEVRAQRPKRFVPTKNGFPSPDHPVQKRFAGMLVKSWDVTQSAIRTCTNTHSLGPDFYSEPEQMFCDMTERKLYPKCQTQDEAEKECFDTILNETRHDSLKKRSELTPYLHVADWL